MGCADKKAASQIRGMTERRRYGMWLLEKITGGIKNIQEPNHSFQLANLDPLVSPAGDFRPSGMLLGHDMTNMRGTTQQFKPLSYTHQTMISRLVWLQHATARVLIQELVAKWDPRPQPGKSFPYRIGMIGRMQSLRKH